MLLWLTQQEARRSRREHARSCQKICMWPCELSVETEAHEKREHRDEKWCHDCLNLNDRNIPNDHVHNLFPWFHVAKIGLSGQTCCKCHIQVAFESKQRWHEYEKLSDFFEDIKFLWRETRWMKLEKLSQCHQQYLSWRVSWLHSSYLNIPENHSSTYRANASEHERNGNLYRDLPPFLYLRSLFVLWWWWVGTWSISRLTVRIVFCWMQ